VGAWILAQFGSFKPVSLFKFANRVSTLEQSKDIRLEFYDGTSESLTLFRDNALNTYSLSKTYLTTSVKITVLSVYTFVNNGAMEIEFWGNFGSYLAGSSTCTEAVTCARQPQGTIPPVRGYTLWLDGADSSVNSMTFSSGTTLSLWKDKSGSGNNFGVTAGLTSSIIDGSSPVVSFPSGAIMTSTAAVTLDATSYVPTTSLTITDGASNDVITVATTVASRALTTVNLATGGADTVIINDLVFLGAGASGLTVTNFTAGTGAGADVMDINLDTTAGANLYLGNYVVVTAAAQAATVLNSTTQLTIFEVNQAAATTTSLTNVAADGAVEIAIATAFGTITAAGETQALVIVYGSGAATGSAGLYAVTFTDGADAVTGNTAVELIGILSGGITADALVSGNFA